MAATSTNIAVLLPLLLAICEHKHAFYHRCLSHNNTRSTAREPHVTG